METLSEEVANREIANSRSHIRSHPFTSAAHGERLQNLELFKFNKEPNEIDELDDEIIKYNPYNRPGGRA